MKPTNVWMRLQQFETAIEYDAAREQPASEEARAIWRAILDKPHYALPIIQAILDKQQR